MSKILRFARLCENSDSNAIPEKPSLIHRAGATISIGGMILVSPFSPSVRVFTQSLARDDNSLSSAVHLRHAAPAHTKQRCSVVHPGDSMKLYTYLNYGGNCRQAFEFYEQHLGGKITFITTHGEMPQPTEVP